MIIRIATADDAEALRGGVFPDLPVETVVTMITWADDHDEACHVADEGGNLVAVVSLTRHANDLERHRAEIGGWVIAPARRGTGLARRVLGHLEDEARAWGGSKTGLGVRGGEHAEAVYRGLGFIEYGRLPSGFVRGHDVHDQVLMYKPLRVPTNGR